MHEAWPRQNATHLKRGGLTLPMTKTVVLPRIAADDCVAGGNLAYAASSTPSGSSPVWA